MTNEIKFGDTVRVSKDAPICIIGSASEIECAAVVLGTNADIAVIGFRTREKQRYDAYKVPFKYLVKVGGEEKEPRFKAGDLVRYRYDSKLYTVECKTGKYHYALRQTDGDIMMYDALESDLEPYTEPTEEKDNTITIPVKAEIDDSFWDAYTADLAKEIVLKLIGKNNDEQMLACYAVKVAKSVVEELKKK